MTDQPKPTPARPQCTELTSEQLLAELDAVLRDSNLATLRWMETAAKRDAENVALQQRVDELERLYDNEGVEVGKLKVLQAELTADLRTAADQCEALSKNLADHKHQLDTMIEENRRLRELLRCVAITAERDDFGSVGVELFEQIKHAIGRTGE